MQDAVRPQVRIATPMYAWWHLQAVLGLRRRLLRHYGVKRWDGLSPHDMDTALAADHLGWQQHRVKAALNYFASFPTEIEEALADNAAYNFETLSRMLPQAERFNAGLEEN